jgi:hypothetical protein
MSQRISNRSPEIFFVLWITFLGVTIWAHASISQQLPFYDAFGYYEKAYNFWSAVHQGHWFNPLNLQWSLRPPGTILMSYPFGFDPDPRGFFFRSAFFPAALLSLAVMVAAYEKSSERQIRWRITLVAVFFSTLPMLYGFGGKYEYWGLVDGFLTGVAALAAAAAWRSVVQRSLAYTAVTALTSSFCILLKPSGTLVAAMIGLTWASLALIQLKGAWSLPPERIAVGKYLVTGALIIGIADVLILAAALSSDYLSPHNFKDGLASAAEIKSEFTLPVSFLWLIVHKGLGGAFVLWMVLAIAAIILGSRSAHRNPTQSSNSRLLAGAAVAAILFLTFGIWFWQIASGFSQIRYGMPFFLIAWILTVPALTQIWTHAPRLLTSCIAAIMLAASTNLGLLLLQENPSSAWQHLSGTAISAGRTSSVINQLKQLVEAPRQRAEFVYSFKDEADDATLTSLCDQHNLFYPEKPQIKVRRAMDWTRGRIHRIDEIYSSDYLLFSPSRDRVVGASGQAGTQSKDFYAEQSAFVAWANSLAPADGVEVVFDSPSARLLHVRDHDSVGRSLLHLVSNYQWRPVFIDANRGNLWHSEADLTSDIAIHPPLLENIEFSDFIKLRSLWVERDGAVAQVRLWWQPLSRLTDDRNLRFFVHVIDDAGNIVQNNEVKLHFIDRDDVADRAIRLSEGSIIVPLGSRRIAVGFFRGDHAEEVLEANAGERDWGGRRVIASLPASKRAAGSRPGFDVVLLSQWAARDQN